MQIFRLIFALYLQYKPTTKNIDMRHTDDFMMPSNVAEVSIIPVFQGESLPKVDDMELPENLPILALRNPVLFPGSIFPVPIGREKSIRLIEDAEKHNLLIGAVPQKDLSVEDPRIEDLSGFGTVARVMKTIPMPDGRITAIVQGLRRFHLDEILEYEPYMYGKVSYRTDIKADSGTTETKVVMDSLKDRAVALAKMDSFIPKETVNSLKTIDDLEFLTNFLATTVDTENYQDKIKLLEEDDIVRRAMALLGILDGQIELMKIKQDINAKVKNEIDQQQREYYLNNQLKTIQEELGMDEEEFEKLSKRADDKIWSKEVREIFDKELAKLERYNPSSPDYSIQYNYLEFMLDLPWGCISEDNLDLRNAQKVLNEDHYGLDKVKDRIIEYLAVLKLKGDMKSPILCLYGPPGVGKTSLGKSVARALGRKYVRIALGGTHDESEIRGHRKTYIGALPGRILNGICRAGTSNPVIVLDEIDKISSDIKGDPSSALLEALDPEQNTTFHDNYLDIDYDLSKVLFITTANNVSSIQPALRDRMEMINVTGYLAEEKEQIAIRHLVPKQLQEHGLSGRQLKFAPETIRAIIDEYTHESGVRGLEKQIAKVARVTARKIATGEKRRVTIRPDMLKEYLGLPVSFHDKQKGNEGPGVVTGLAWTEMGGEILFVESSVSTGKGNLSMTGNLGDVMKESATIAYQFIKAHPELTGMSYEEFAAKDVHVHVPEGATPKDGPSAGITLVCSMISAFRQQAIRSGVAMTGETTLRGKVLPVGGIKEKILAAKRSGVHTIVICEDNRKDVEDIPANYVAGLDFHYVKTIEDVIDFVFEK